MKLHEYLEDHGILMAGMLLVFLLQCVLLVFLGMPAGLAILLCGMWLLFFLLYFIQDYHRKNRRRKELCAIIDSMEKRYLMHEMLPKGANHEEAFYRRLLYLGNKSMLEEIGTVQRSRREYQDYVEQWVHEIKTPIAAMKLSIENQQGERKRQLFQQLDAWSIMWSRCCFMREVNLWKRIFVSSRYHYPPAFRRHCCNVNICVHRLLCRFVFPSRMLLSIQMKNG